MRTRVNGELQQEAPTSALIVDTSVLISTLSAALTLEPGDVMATGTGRGVGIGPDPRRYLAAATSLRSPSTGSELSATPFDDDPVPNRGGEPRPESRSGSVYPAPGPRPVGVSFVDPA